MDIKTKELGLEGENIKAMYTIVDTNGEVQGLGGSRTDENNKIHTGVMRILMQGRSFATEGLGIRIRDLKKGDSVKVTAEQGTFILTIEEHTSEHSFGFVRKNTDETTDFMDVGSGFKLPARIIVGEAFTLAPKQEVLGMKERITPLCFSVLVSGSNIP